MATYNYRAGLGHVGSYQVSGTPFVTGGVDCTVATRIVFPSVTRWVSVNNNDTDNQPRVGFSENGVNGSNYIMMGEASGGGGAAKPAGNPAYPMEIRVTELWISGSDDVDVIAGLTGIATNTINNGDVSPDGTNWSGSANAVVG